MLRFLKSLFGRTAQAERQPAATVALPELEEWLKQSRAPAEENMAVQLATASARTGQLATLVREKIDALRAAQLMNPDIPERAKDFMQGNREEYSRRVTQYLDSLTLPTSAEELAAFFASHQQQAQEFTQGILRPFQVLQEFFAHESKEITALLAQMEQEIMALRALHESARLEKHDALAEEIQTLIVRQQQLNGLQRERLGLEQQRAEAEQSLKALTTEEERLLKEPVRLALLGALGNEQKLIRDHEQKIRDVFANLEPALRKFCRMATRHVKLSERYLREPVGTLIEDLHLDIIEILADIERLANFDRLQLGDKKEYVRDALAMLTKDYLGTWLREYGQLARKEKGAQRAIEDCAASKTLARIQRLREETRRNAQITEQRLAQVSKDIGKIDLAALKSRLEERLKEATGIAVTITF